VVRLPEDVGEDGSTAAFLVAFPEPRGYKVLVGNLGDSRTILGKYQDGISDCGDASDGRVSDVCLAGKYKCQPLSKDHKSTDPAVRHLLDANSSS